jgi:hypothetical protein
MPKKGKQSSILAELKAIRRDDDKIARNPPVIRQDLHVRQTLRFTFLSSQNAKAITYGNFNNLYLMSDGASTSYFTLFSSIKVRKISMWAPPRASASDYQDLDIHWMGQTDTRMVKSNISVNQSAAYVTSRPPVDSYANLWMSQGINTGTDAVRLTAPQGTVLDLEFDAVLVSDTQYVATVITLDSVAPFTQLMVVNYLDGTGGEIVPASGLIAFF